jgi:small subunit ribosomal protein S2
LFIGTKKQAQDPIKFFADKCGMPYINERWLGGMLTNFDTISKRVQKMQDYERMRDTGEFELMPKKEALLISRELEKLQKNLSGIRNMARRPTAVFIIDTMKESIAVTEANKLGLPVIAVVDTNVNPDLITFPIPGNDDAIRANELMARVICEAVIEGRFIAEKTSGRSSAPAAAPAPRSADEQAAFEAQQDAARKSATEAQAQRDARVASATETKVEG